MSVGRTVLGLDCDCRCYLVVFVLLFCFLYCPSLNAFFVWLVGWLVGWLVSFCFVSFSLQRAELLCILEVRAL